MERLSSLVEALALTTDTCPSTGDLRQNLSQVLISSIDLPSHIAGAHMHGLGPHLEETTAAPPCSRRRA
jgi:hypothetical protein